MYPAVCAVQDRRDVLREVFVTSNRLGLIWALPFGIGLALFAPDLVDFVLGSTWDEAIPLMQIFGLIFAFRHDRLRLGRLLQGAGEHPPDRGGGGRLGRDLLRGERCR